MKCIEDEIPFELPQGWAWTRLGALAQYKKGPFGSSITKAMFVPDTPNAIKVYEQKNAINKDETLGSYYITEEKFETLKGFEVFPNDIIVSCAGTIGETFIMPLTMRKGVINQALMKISLYNLQITDFYLLYFDFKLKEDARNQGYGVALKNIPPFDILKSYLIPIPPISEQARIISQKNVLLNLVDRISNDDEELLNLISIVKSKILDLAIRGKLVPQDENDEPVSVLLERIRAEKEELIKAGKIKRDKKESVIFKGEDNSYYQRFADKDDDCFEVPFELPQSWTWATLSMIGTTNIGLTYKPSDIVTTGTPVLRSNNIVNGKIQLSDLIRVNSSIRENQYMQKNDILICSRNGSKALVGKCAIFHSDKEKTSFGAFMAVYRSQFYQYVYHYMNSWYFRSLFESDDSKQINQLTQDMIKTATVPFPPLTEQQRIVEAIETAFTQLDNIANLIA